MAHISNFLSAMALCAVLSLGAAAQTATTSRDVQLQAVITHKLQDKKEFKNVTATVQDGVATLQGTVDKYQQKLDLEKRVRKEHPAEVRNLVAVAGPAVSDEQLQSELASKLRYDRYGYGSVFNYIALGVKDGVVTLGGEVRTPMDKDSALALVNNTPGVKDVVDNLKIAPVSGFDDQLRVRLFRAIYGDPVLSGYSLDPQMPIRIVVNNGHVALFGRVQTQLEKQVAGVRANQVFGAFTVQNNIVSDHDLPR
jgi:osmotically-inducible protein OsmY